MNLVSRAAVLIYNKGKNWKISQCSKTPATKQPMTYNENSQSKLEYHHGLQAKENNSA